MIPKKIHYCWFGRGELPELAVKCIESWKKYLPDYEIIVWNEDNFDINLNQYVKEAYESRKFAFVTDYVRLYALYCHGGVYMDTDIEVLRSLDTFLLYRAFVGCEQEQLIQTGLIGAEKGHPWIGKILKTYDNRKFILPNGKLDTTPNPQIITRLTIDNYGWIPEDKYQVLKDELHIYPLEVFCAKDWRTGKLSVTEQTYTIHHFSGSWITEEERKRLGRKRKIKMLLTNAIGRKGFLVLLNVRNLILGLRNR